MIGFYLFLCYCISISLSVVISPNGTLPTNIWVQGNTPINGYYSFYFNSTINDEVTIELRGDLNVFMLLYDGIGLNIFGLTTNNPGARSTCSADFSNPNGIREVRMSSIDSISHFYEIKINIRNTLIIPDINSALYRTIVDSDIIPRSRGYYSINVESLVEQPLRIFFDFIQLSGNFIIFIEKIKVKFQECPGVLGNDIVKIFDDTTSFPIIIEIGLNTSSFVPLSVGTYYIATEIFLIDECIYGIGACFGKDCVVNFNESGLLNTQISSSSISSSSIFTPVNYALVVLTLFFFFGILRIATIKKLGNY